MPFKSLPYARKNPYFLMVWLGILGSGIIFMFLTTAFVSRWNQPDYENFRLPFVFYLSTAILLASSLSIFHAQQQLKIEEFSSYKFWLGITLALGCLFMVTQLVGWAELHSSGQALNRSIAGAYIYILSGLHVLHIVVGLALLIWVFLDASKQKNYVDGYLASINPGNKTRLKMLTIYWHFVDILWLYLFVLFLINHS